MAGNKFSMTQNALVDLGRRTNNESDDLGVLVRRLGEAAEPLQASFNGPARSTFNNFKSKTDQISVQLNNALSGICGSIAGQNMAFNEGAEQGADTHSGAEGSQDWSSEAFLARISPQ